jgi:hypothetical protein
MLEGIETKLAVGRRVDLAAIMFLLVQLLLAERSDGSRP